jgi:hypothetical protein
VEEEEEEEDKKVKEPCVLHSLHGLCSHLVMCVVVGVGFFFRCDGSGQELGVVSVCVCARARVVFCTTQSFQRIEILLSCFSMSALQVISNDY